jgi:hypothetical protein
MLEAYNLVPSELQPTGEATSHVFVSKLRRPRHMENRRPQMKTQPMSVQLEPSNDTQARRAKWTIEKLRLKELHKLKVNEG